MDFIGNLFVLIKNALLEYDGKKYVEVEQVYRTKDGTFKIKFLMERKDALKLVSSSPEASSRARPGREAKG